MTSMIDWVTADIPCEHSGVIMGGKVLMLDMDGSIEYSKDRWLPIVGSYSSKVVIQAEDPDRTWAEHSRYPGWLGRLHISGNLAKFLQGHNLFGTGDVNYLVWATMEVISARLGLPATENDRASWRRGLYFLSRVDVTRMYDLGAPARVNDWLVSSAQVAHNRYQGAGNNTGSTIYIGKNSRRVSLKFYDKQKEMQVRGHGLSDTLPVGYYHKLEQFAVGKLRVEATFRSMWLKDNNRALGSCWLPSVADMLLEKQIGGLELNDTMKLSDDYIGGLPGRLAVVYDAWRAGRDLSSMFPKRTFFRYRSQLLAYGIDIAHVRPREVVTENQYLLGAPLKSFLQGGGVEVPDWAIGTEMYASA